MPKQRATSASDETPFDKDSLALQMVELFNDGRILQALKKQLYPRELYDKLDTLTKKIELLTDQLNEKDIKIEYLEKKADKLESQLDNLEQYSRRANLRIQGIHEDTAGEDIPRKVLHVINDEMGCHPPLTPTDIERAHRVGRAAAGMPRPRAVIVRFASERMRDVVYRSRGSLKGYNDAHQADARIYLNEDLTSRRATLAYLTRELKKGGKVNDCWTFNGRILVKNRDNRILEITSDVDLRQFVDK